MVRLSLFLVAVVAFGAATASLRRVCYYTNWAQYRNGIGKFFPENVDPSLCTHIIYAFAKMQGNHLKAFEWNDESTSWMKGMYERFHNLKQSNPSIKLLLAVGGWNMGSAPFTQMAATAAGRQEFATSTVAFLRKNKFDGIDMDWEYPANRGSPPEDKKRFTLVVQALHDEFAKENVPSGQQRLMITAAVAAGKDKIDTAYEIPEISRLLDFINLMTYDLHGSWEDHTGHNAPLFSRSSETGNDTYLNVAWAAQYWVQKGAPREMINVGLGLYGRSFSLPWGQTETDIGCPAKGAGSAGVHTSEAGFMAYYEICEKLKGGATKKYEPEQKVPYMVKNDLWVGYDDPDSLRLKVDYIKKEGFGGIMVWALDLDDFSGSCGEGKYPLMHAIVNELESAPGPASTQPTPAPVTTAPQQGTTGAPMGSNPPVTTWKPIVQSTQGSHSNMHQLTHVSSNEFNCAARSDGYYPSPTSCTHYFVCAAGITFRTDCHPGLQFNSLTLYCDFPDHVECSASNTAAQTTAAVTMKAPVTTNGPAKTQAPMTTKGPAATQAPITTKGPAPTQAPATTQAPVTTKAPLPTTTQTPTTTVPVHVDPADFCKGKSDGFHGDPADCAVYYQCYSEVSYPKTCASGTYYKESIKGCDWAGNVPNCP